MPRGILKIMKPEFVFVACRYGSENLCKQEIAEQCTDLRFSFSQKGFLTFKADKSTANFQKINSLTFARLAGISLGSIDAEGPEFYNHLEEILSKSECLQKVKHLHVWDRNLGSGDEVLLEWLANGGSGSNHPIATDELSKFCSQKGWAINRHAKQDDHVIDLIRMDKNQYWIGYHVVESGQQCIPGGVPIFGVPEKIVSRAYFKTREAIHWSRIPFQEGDVCVEIGSAPGGSSQALLTKKLRVVGVDPADMDPSIVANPNFLQIKKRISDLRKKDIADARWLLSDSNVAPGYTLDTVEDIVQNQYMNIKGMILTFKIMQEKQIKDLPTYREQIRSLGFRYVRMRQLAFNRQELCVVALKNKSMLRFGRLKNKQKKST
jgi:23S rRNA (cytidine2498-2'-O)-methyltransferase